MSDISDDLIEQGKKTLFRGKYLETYSKEELMGMIAWLLNKQSKKDSCAGDLRRMLGL